MTDKEIYEGIKKYFCLEELVSRFVFRTFGQTAWQFLDIRMLHTLLVVREGLDRSITVNNWKWGGKFGQRGLRTNVGYIFAKFIARLKIYLSSHIMGKAVDFDVKGMTPDQVRDWLHRNASILPNPIRLEHKFNKTGKTITWVHMDVFSYIDSPKIYLFNI